ncbi:MAG TPA: caspase family protein [Bradyrhizobium sp.]
MVATFVLAVAPVAHAEKRFALVIGQSAYRAVVALPNPSNDARKMSELLGTAGFDVTAASDLTQNQMREAVGDFAAKIAANGPDAVALLFYAGHGLQIDGENYLVPVDVDPKRETDIPLQAVRLNDVMNTLGALPTRLRIVMLDACRNNPFPALGTGTGHGLAIVDTKAGSAGSFISYSTSPGAVAEDGSGEDSPYTTAVLNFAREPNLPIEEAFKRVRVAVNEVTDGRQIPWDSSSLTTDFRFFGDQAGKPAQATDKKAGADSQPSVKRSVEDWRKELKGKDQKVAYQLVIADDTVPAYEAFVAMYAQPPYNVRVRALLERRYVMQAWAIAVATNTVASYQTFLATYANSDLAVTARKLQDRVRNREFGPLPAAVALLGPTCPCPAPQQPLRKRVEEPAPKKQRAEAPKERKQQPAGQKEEGIPPEAIGIGIGIGLGMGGGMGGGGGGRGGGGMSGGSGGHYGR